MLLEFSKSLGKNPPFKILKVKMFVQQQQILAVSKIPSKHLQLLINFYCLFMKLIQMQINLIHSKMYKLFIC